MEMMHTSRHLTNDRISTNKKSGLAIVVLMLVSLLATFSPQASASEIVLTDPIEVVQSGVHNDRMMSMDADSSGNVHVVWSCLLYTSPSPRDRTRSRMPSSA